MTKSELLSVDGVPLSVAYAGAVDRPIHIIWAHGWGQSGAAMLPIAESLSSFAHSTVLDFPGFGQSPLPPLTWSTADFADHIAKWLATTPEECRIWVGHSFGCRIGLQLAARHPGLLSGMVLIAAAGLQRKRPLPARIKFFLRRNLFRMAKGVLPEGPLLNKMRSRLGSSDYKTAGELRPIFSRVIAEDLTDIARKVTCPTLLIYGEKDTDTPPEIGQRLHQLIAGSRLLLLSDFDHHTILLDGRHQIAVQIKAFAEKTVQCPT